MARLLSSVAPSWKCPSSSALAMGHEMSTKSRQWPMNQCLMMDGGGHTQ